MKILILILFFLCPLSCIEEKNKQDPKGIYCAGIDQVTLDNFKLKQLDENYFQQIRNQFPIYTEYFGMIMCFTNCMTIYCRQAVLSIKNPYWDQIFIHQLGHVQFNLYSSKCTDKKIEDVMKEVLSFTFIEDYLETQGEFYADEIGYTWWNYCSSDYIEGTKTQYDDNF